MLDPVTAEVKLIHRNHVFGEVVTNAVIHPKFPLDGFLGGQQVTHLNVQPFIPFSSNEVNLLLAGFAYRHGIAPAKQLHENDVLQNEVAVPHISAKDCLPDAVIRDIVFLVGRQNSLPLQILTPDAIEQESIQAVFDIIQHSFCGNNAALAFEVFDIDVAEKKSSRTSPNRQLPVSHQKRGIPFPSCRRYGLWSPDEAPERC